MTDPLHGKGPVFRLFVEVATLPPEQRKAALLPRLEHLWETAMARTYESKRGPVLNPDVATALKVVEVADALLADGGEAAGRGKLAGLSVFNGGKAKAG